MSIGADKSIIVKVNGTRITNLTSVDSTFERERVITDGVLTAPGAVMYVKLTRVRYLNDPYSDGLELRALKNFTLEINTPEYISTYKNCQWLGFREIIGQDNTIIEEMNISSLEYGMVSF